MARNGALTWAALALAGCLALCPGCAGDGDGDGAGEGVTLQFWAMGREGEVVRELIGDFERTHPGIHVKVQQIPWTAAHEKLLTAYVGRKTPDVVQLGNTWIPEFAAIGAIEPLDPYVRRSTTLAAGDFFPGIWETNVVDGTTFGVPWYVDTRVLFYRTDTLAAAGHPEPPKTWSEWRAAMEAVKARLGPDKWAIVLPTDEWAQPVILGLQNGAELLRDGGRHGAFAAPEFVRAAQFYVDMFAGGLAPKASNAQIANVYHQFAAGDFALYITGPWNLGEFRRRLPPEAQGTWSTAPLPAPDGKPYPGVSIAGGSSLAVFRGSPRKDAAWQLVEFLSATGTQVRFYRLTGDLPARIAAWQDPLLADDGKARAFRVQLDHVVPLPRVPEWEQIAFQQLIDRLETSIRGRTPVQQAMTALDADVERTLEKRRYLLDRGGR